MTLLNSHHRVIIIAGPDGSGKTTLALELKRRVDRTNLCVRHEHFIPQLARTLEQNRPVVDRPHYLKPRSFLASVLSILYRYCSFVLASIILRLKGPRDSLIIRERGWIDQAVDPRRYRLSSSSIFLVKLLSHLAPQPWLIVLCGGDAQTISLRKFEISRDETDRQLKEWIRSLRKRKWVFVNTTDLGRNIHSIADELVQEIFPHFTAPSRLSTVRLFASRYNAMASKCDGHVGLRATAPGYSIKASLAHTIAMSAHAILPAKVPGDIPFPVEELLGEQWRDQTLSMIRSASRQRWVLALGSNKSIHAVAKVELTNVGSISREIRALEYLSGRTVSFDIPEVIQVSESGVWTSVILKYMKSSRRALSIRDALELTVELARADITHGDFTPWNALAGERHILLDWEYSHIGLDPGFDLMRFALVSGYLNLEQLEGWLIDGNALPSPFGNILEQYQTKTGLDVRHSLVELPTELNLLARPRWSP